MNLKSFFGITCISAILLLLGGCATVSGSGSNQSISVETFNADGSQVEGAKCDMTNDEGTWFVVTPGSTVIHRSNKDLQVVCKKTGVDVGTAAVVSRTKGNMFGNIILGGGIGAIIDHNNGTAYEYPGLIKIFMGRSNQKIETQPQDSAQSTQPIEANKSSASLVPSKGTETSKIEPSDSSLTPAKKKCEELGFKPATEAFGSCVLKLAEK